MIPDEELLDYDVVNYDIHQHTASWSLVVTLLCRFGHPDEREDADVDTVRVIGLAEFAGATGVGGPDALRAAIANAISNAYAAREGRSPLNITRAAPPSPPERVAANGATPPKAPPAPAPLPSLLGGEWWDTCDPHDWRRIAVAVRMSQEARWKLWSQVTGLATSDLAAHIPTDEEYFRVYQVLVSLARSHAASGDPPKRPTDEELVAEMANTKKGGSTANSRSTPK